MKLKLGVDITLNDVCIALGISQEEIFKRGAYNRTYKHLSPRAYVSYFFDSLNYRHINKLWGYYYWTQHTKRHTKMCIEDIIHPYVYEYLDVKEKLELLISIKEQQYES